MGNLTVGTETQYAKDAATITRYATYLATVITVTEYITTVAQSNDTNYNWMNWFQLKAGKHHDQRTSYSNISSLTLSSPIPLRLYTLPYWYNSPFLISDIRTLRTECQSAQMSKIKNGGLDQYGAETFKQQQFGTSGGVKRNHSIIGVQGQQWI